jgi:hypothetical protein
VRDGGWSCLGTSWVLVLGGLHVCECCACLVELGCSCSYGCGCKREWLDEDDGERMKVMNLCPEVNFQKMATVYCERTRAIWSMIAK